MDNMKQMICPKCDTAFFPEEDEILCLACELEEEEVFPSLDDQDYDAMYDGMTQDYGNAEY